MTDAYRMVIAILRLEDLESVERALRDTKVCGVSVSAVKGYGEYKDFYQRDWFGKYARLEIFTSAARAQTIVATILETASSGTRGDGIVCTIPVECVWRIRSSAIADPEEL